MTTVTLETISKSIEDLTDVVIKFVPYVERRFDGLEKELTDFKEEMYDFKGHVLRFEEETKGTLYEIDRHARVTNERLTGIEDRFETVETKIDVVVYEIKNHDKRTSVSEHDSKT